MDHIEHKALEKHRKDIIAAAARKKRRCLIENCHNTAIDSHLLQRKGVLNHIISGNHLYQVTYFQFPEVHYTIKKIGWKDSLTFNGLCAHHDSKLFESIEKSNIDFTDQKSLLLLSLRPLLYEYRQKEIVIDAAQKFLIDNRLMHFIDPISTLTFIEGQTYLKWDLEFLLMSLYEEINANQKNFKFHTYSLPKIDVCTSITFSLQSLGRSFRTFPTIDFSRKELIASMLFHLIPDKHETKVVFGYHKTSESYVKPKVFLFQRADIDKRLKLISDILIRNCGIWACSEKFYFQQIKSRARDVIKQMNYFTLRKTYDNDEVGLNLFDGLNFTDSRHNQ